MSRKWNASSTVAALTAVILLFITAIALIGISRFSTLNSDRDSYLKQGKWFLEGKVQEYFDRVLSGQSALIPGKWENKFQAGNTEQTLRYELAQKDASHFQLVVSVAWNGRYFIKQTLEFSRWDLFDYALLFNGSVNLKAGRNFAVSGDIAVVGTLSVSSAKDGGINFPANNNSRIDYYSSPPNLRPGVFKNSLTNLIFNPEARVDVLSNSRAKYALVKKNTRLELPVFQDIWNTFLPLRDSLWSINSTAYVSTEKIYNPLTSEKLLFARGDGSSTKFTYPYNLLQNIYVKKIANLNLYQQISSRDYLYSYGQETKNNTYYLDRDTLVLRNSREPMLTILPETSYQVLGELLLSGPEFSAISSDETIESVYLRMVMQINRLSYGDEFIFDRSTRTLRMMTKRYLLNSSYNLGTGDGVVNTYPYPQFMGNSYFYIGGRKTTAYTVLNNRITFNPNPPSGLPVTAFSPPAVFIKKNPPSEGTGIFTDRQDEAVRIDLNRIQNSPKNGIIMANQPLYITGESNFPLIIISTEAVYLDNINPKNTGWPVMIISGKGIWAYQKNSEKSVKLNKCILYSPLNSIYAFKEDGTAADIPVTVYGSVVLNFQNQAGVMDFAVHDANVIYDPEISNIMRMKPYSYFPLPLLFETIQR